MVSDMILDCLRNQVFIFIQRLKVLRIPAIKEYINFIKIQPCQRKKQRKIHSAKRYSKSDINHIYKSEFVISIDDFKDEMWLFSVVGKEKKYSYLEFKELNRLLKGLCKDLHNHTSFKNVTVSIAEKRGRKATHLKIAYQHVSDIYKQEQRELDAEEKRLGIR